MKVVYSRLYNLGNYENERFEVEEEIGADETPRTAAQRLRQLVELMQSDAATWRAEMQRLRDAEREREREARRRALEGQRQQEEREEVGF